MMGQIEDKNKSALDHVIRLIATHPEYLKYFLKTQNFLLRADGPLSFEYRNYIAIMAAARHQNTRLMSHYKEEFTLQGGCVVWLEGLEHIPGKLRDLNEINKILAHRPWLLKKSHIEKLTKGRRKNWSLGELVQAIVIMAHFHSLCSFVFASEILDDPPPTKQTACKPEETVDELMGKIQQFQQTKTNSKYPKELISRGEMLRFVDDNTSVLRENIAAQDDTSSTFLIQDCSWEVHAFCILDRCYNEIGTILDEKFKVAYDLTYYTMGHQKNVDTTIFRRAVWNYIHKIYGITHDDYNYEEVEELLEPNFREYIETLCFAPEKISKKAHEGIMQAFRYSEKIHVNLMLFEARLQAELLYALNAIMMYMSG